ncbi:MAG: type I glyceraldehyde-3-phosphate dehydrogenase [Alphaproteobacteria bacterium]|jgi:glyceraldehyde 3-phosphate dehydrogenase|nr:type I glyceraldehyde-3-phosphate dehydrogenase [Alphaproteobacteria bacterium]MBT5390104.1 type I glyceraldehyde-3-phosphate dehydrogenase [Alphaproteobacteria bacterium]
MAIRVAINGFGRIGRLVLRAFLESSKTDIEIVAINDLGSLETNVHLFQYDSVHGRYDKKINIAADAFVVDGHAIKVLSESDPAALPWQDLDVDIVFECSGRFTSREKAELHLKAGAKKVLISAPAANADATIVYGVNQQTLQPEDVIVSNASCTTNCLAPIADVLQRAVGIQKGFMTTIHAYTGDQNLVDGYHPIDPRRARASGLSLIPTSTGAAKAVGLVLPELAGKLDGTAIRVPTPNVSVVDFTFVSSKKTSPSEINDAIITASKKPQFRGILETNELPLVSIDFNHCAASSIFDLTQTQVVQGDFCRVLAWYDNEWGFSNRMLQTAAVMGTL